MPIILIILIIAIIGIVAATGGFSGATANLAAPTPPTPPVLDSTGNVATDNTTAVIDQGFSPLDVGGVNLSVPNAVLNWNDLAQKYASINSILDPEEILAIIWNESSGNPNAFNPNDPSRGLMGVTDLIGTAYASSQGNALFDPETNIKAGSGYLAHLKSRFGNDEGWAESYNEGETNYSKGKHYNPSYATNFNQRVLALKGIG